MYYTTIENFNKYTKNAKDITDTKKAKGYIKNYINSCYYSIEECYKNPSRNKYLAELEIKQKIENLEGNDLLYKIISFNSCCFNCGYIVTVEELNNYINYLIIETACNTYIIRI